MHSDLLIETGRACWVGSVHAQADRFYAALVKITKGVQQQCLSQSAFAPCSAHTQGSDPADSHAKTILRKACNLVTIPCDQPERRVKILVAKLPQRPAFKLHRMASPLISKR